MPEASSSRFNEEDFFQTYIMLLLDRKTGIDVDPVMKFKDITLNGNATETPPQKGRVEPLFQWLLIEVLIYHTKWIQNTSFRNCVIHSHHSSWGQLEVGKLVRSRTKSGDKREPIEQNWSHRRQNFLPTSFPSPVRYVDG